MGKYEPLTEHLRRQPKDYVEMTFKEIEDIIEEKLPPSAKVHRAWWSNNRENKSMASAWLASGFRSARVNMKAGKLTFRRDHPRELDEADKRSAEKRYPTLKRHSLIGWMKGTVTIAPGVDLTEPADPEWGERVWGDQK